MLLLEHLGRKKKSSGWKSAINQMDLAGWRRACLMCGVLSMEGLVPISVLQSVPVSSRDAARVLKKLHLFSAGQQKGTEFRQRYKWCIHVRWQQALQPKVRFPNFISSPFVVPSLPVALVEIKYTEWVLCHYLYYRWQRQRICFLWLPNLWEWRQEIKSSTFISHLLSFSIWSVC